MKFARFLIKLLFWFVDLDLESDSVLTARFTGVIFDYDKEMEILVTGFSGINRVDLWIMMMVAM